MDVYFKKVPSKAGRIPETPVYSTSVSSGMDLFANIDEDLFIYPGEILTVPTGIIISSNHPCFVYARSGLAIKHGICLANGVGVIDADYIGEIMVGLLNISKNKFTISPGNRIAQIVFSEIIRAQLIEKEDLNITERGVGGFGSTGI